MVTFQNSIWEYNHIPLPSTATVNFTTGTTSGTYYELDNMSSYTWRYAYGEGRWKIAWPSSSGTTSPITWSDNVTGTTTVWYTYNFSPPIPKTPQQQIQEMLRARSAPPVLTHRGFLPHTTDERELRARETLREFIGNDRWKRFMRDGFITVHSRKDQRTYQIFPGDEVSNITRVYERGVMTERLCCYLRGGFPATDHLLARFLLILNSPAEFRKLCVVHSAIASRPTTEMVSPDTDLVTEFKRIKGAA